MLTVVKSLNNNIILAVNDEGDEFVLFGTGIGFNKKKGEQLTFEQATKVFKPSSDSPMTEWLDDIPVNVLTVTEKIVSLGEARLNRKLNASLLFSLADHLRFAMKRHQDELELDSPFQWEIPHLYFEEYQVGKEAVALIKKELSIDLPLTEASFIALHMVNAQMDSQLMGDTIQLTQITKEIVKIIQSSFDRTLDKSTMIYSRFITHLRYFIARQKVEGDTVIEVDSELKELIKKRYVKSYTCGVRIKEHLQNDQGWQVTEDELIYLVIHIERIIKENTI